MYSLRCLKRLAPGNCPVIGARENISEETRVKRGKRGRPGSFLFISGQTNTRTHPAALLHLISKIVIGRDAVLCVPNFSDHLHIVFGVRTISYPFMPDFQEPGRRTPAKGVHVSYTGPNWVFLTVCAENRERWLSEKLVQATLHKIWLQNATTWLVSDYLLMPDHLHLFCAPYNLEVDIEKWITYWKYKFSRTQISKGRFQRGGFHHRLRNGENYSDKWQYVRENPVRQKLVERSEDWPFYGRVHEICW